jgi:DNA polymerase I
VLKKKKYCYLGDKGLEFVGIDAIRSDISEYGKQMLTKTVNLLFSGMAPQEIARKMVQEVDRDVEKITPDNLGVPKGMIKSPKEYTNKTVWVRGALAANDLFGLNIKKGDKPKMLYIKKSWKFEDCICFFRETDIDWSQIEIDYETIKAKTIFPKIYQVLEPFMSYEDFIHSPITKLERWF